MNKIRRAITAAALCAVQLFAAVTLTLPAAAASVGVSINTIAVGANHTLVIKSDNTLWGSGKNYYKQLSGACADNSSDKLVQIMSNVISVAAGGNTSLAIDKQKNLYVWGENDNGQINTEPYDIVSTPVKILTDVESVSASATHILAVTTDGSLYAWGSNSRGQLGYASSGSKVPVKKIMDNVSSAAAGDGFSLVVTTDGKLYSFGANENGQLGLGDFMDVDVPKLALSSDVVMAAAGKTHSVVLMKNGTVYCAGLNDNGQLGTGNFMMKSTFEKTSLTDIASVFAGGNSSGALSTKNNLFTWGSNGNGQLHNGKTDDEESPVSITTGVVSFAVSNTYSIILKENGALSSAGTGVYGELLETTKTSIMKPALVGKDYDFISAGRNHMAAIDIDGNLFMWGSNEYGQLGTGDYDIRITPTAIKLPDDDKAKEVWCGDGYTFVRSRTGAFYCFGNNAAYQLGMTTKTSSINKPMENIELTGSGAELSLASDHVIALYDGAVYGWGKNTSYTLGILPELVKSPRIIDDELVNIKSISAGDYHSIALDRDGRIHAWGSNSAGQLAVIAAKSVRFPELIEVMGEKYTIVDGKKEKTEYEVLFNEVLAAGTHTIAIANDDTVWAWGSNGYGQLGTTISRVSEPTPINANAKVIVTSTTASATINTNDRLYFSGKNISGRFGIENEKDLTSFSTLTASNVSDVAIGEDFTAYLLLDGTLYTCGSNGQGQLGNGSFGAKTIPTTVMTGCLIAAPTYADSITLDKSEITIKPNGTTVLTATVLPADADDKTVTWKTSDEKIVTVKNGIIVGVANGTATVTAYAANGTLSASCKVNVSTPVTLITFGRSTKALVQGKTYQLNTKVYPAAADDKAVKYTTTDADVATVSDTGLITATGAGKAVITATSISNPTVTKKLTVTVTPAKTKILSKTRTSEGVTIKWRDMGKVTGYEIYRKIMKAGTYKSVAEIEDGSMEYLDTDVTKGKYYYYKIKTYTIVDGEKVYSKYSPVVNIKFK